MSARGQTLRLVTAGASSVAVTFGLARYGYGLLLPDIRSSLALDSATLGLIGTGSFAAYLIATVAAGGLAGRVGSRPLVVVGGALAVAGMLLVAVAPSAGWLAAGILVAGASSGLVFPPFADAVEARVPAPMRGRAMAAISSGTGWGVLVSVPVALAAGADWRLAWVLFAALALAATLWAFFALKDPQATAGAAATRRRPVDRLSPGWFLCPRSGPLLAGALLIGLGSSVYWTFAVDLVADAGAAPSSARLVLAVVGAASLAGALTGELLERLGGRATLAGGSLALAAALGLIAAAPGSWPAVVGSALLFGAAYNVLIAAEAIWSARVFANRPATGLAALMFVLAVGLLLGPAAGGALAAAAGMPAAFAAGAVVIALSAPLFPREEVRPSFSAA